MADKQSLSVCSFNLHGFKNGFNTARDLCNSFDLVAVQEHWLRKDNLHNLALINKNFSYFGISGMGEASCNGLLRGRPFGGVAILWNTSVIKKVTVIGTGPAGRCAAIKVVFGTYAILVINVYFPCFDVSADYTHDLHECIGYIESLLTNEVYSDVIICGDFNFPCALQNTGYRLFFSLMTDFGLSHCDDLICNDARVTYVNTALGHSSLIDHFIVSSRLKELVANCDILSPVNNFSDHKPLSCIFNLNTGLFDSAFSAVGTGVKKIHHLRWDKADLSAFYEQSRIYLSSINVDKGCFSCNGNCSDGTHNSTINEYYVAIIEALLQASQVTVPSIPAKSLRPFWTDELDDLKAKSVFWFRIWQDSGRPPSGTLHQIKASTQLKYKLAIRQAFVDFENRHTDELHMHFLNKSLPEFWKVWNKKFNKSVASHVSINGSVNDQQIADAFAVHFSDVFTAIPSDKYETSNTIIDNRSLLAPDDANIINYELLDICIRNLKCGKASGPDGLTAEHLLHAHPLVITHICLLFRAMIAHSFVPDDFGLGIIIPLVKDKSGDFNSVDNYRGITLTPIISKLLEGVLLACCEEQLAADDLQYGFRKKVGCADAIFTLRYVVDHFTARGSMVYAAALDISKAFDTVNHRQLMTKLSQVGIPNWITNLISNWYSKLHVAVRWNGCLSEYFKVNSGVRQGSILSPALFNLYINQLIVDLRLCSSGCHVNNCFIGCIFYADDIILLSASVAGLQDLLNVCDQSVSDLSLKFNCTKSFCIAFGHKYDTAISDMKLGKDTICWSVSIKYLGLLLLSGRSVIVDDALIKRKFYASCNAILSNSVGQSELTRLFLMETYCLPILTYCTMAINVSQKALQSFNVCWNMMYRRVFNFNKWESVSLFIAGIGRLNFIHIYQWLQFKMLKKFVHCSTFVVKHLMQCYLLESDLIELCRKYDICLTMPVNAIKNALTEHFWSAAGLIDC
jgi:exonuclease III